MVLVAALPRMFNSSSFDLFAKPDENLGIESQDILVMAWLLGSIRSMARSKPISIVASTCGSLPEAH